MNEMRAPEVRIRELEAGLLASETRHRAVLDSALDAIIAMDAAGRIVEFNRAAEEMFGCARAQALGCSLADLIVPPRLRRPTSAGWNACGAAASRA